MTSLTERVVGLDDGAAAVVHDAPAGEEDVQDDDEGRGDEGTVVVLARQVVALERPVKIRDVLDPRERVAVRQRTCRCEAENVSL